MAFTDLEIFVFSRGLLGCRLKEIPTNLLGQFSRSPNLEIVQSRICTSFPTSINEEHFANSKRYTLTEAKDPNNFSMKPTVEAFRRVIFGGKAIHSGILSAFVSYLIQSPTGIERTDIKNLIPGSEKNISKWIKVLSMQEIIYLSDSGRIIHFNRSIIDPHAVRLASTSVPVELEPEMLTNAKSIIRDHENGIPYDSLKSLLQAEDSVMQEIITNLESQGSYKLLESSEARKIIYMNENNSKINILLSICHSLRLFLLSEQSKELKQFKKEVDMTDEHMVEILEDKGFKVIEIRYKYMNSDFLVYDNGVDEDSDEFRDLVEKAQSKIARYFKHKIQATFLRNPVMTVLDNNYCPILKERVMVFYKFISAKISKTNGFFYLCVNSLKTMDFHSFIKIVPLRAEFQFLEIMTEVVKNEKLPKKYFESLSEEEFASLNSQYLELAKKYSVADVLEILGDGSEAKACLLQRVCLSEFEKILISVVKYNIFEGFSDDKYIYFEAIEGIEGYIDRTLQSIVEEGEVSEPFVQYPGRRLFYEHITKFSPHEFYYMAKKRIDEDLKGEEKEFFSKKLLGFEE